MSTLDTDPGLLQPNGAQCPPKPISDHYTHYISVVLFEYRAAFWSLDHPVWQDELKIQKIKLSNAAAAFAKAATARAKVHKKQAGQELAAAGDNEERRSTARLHLERALEELADAEKLIKAAKRSEENMEKAKELVRRKLGATAFKVRSLHHRVRIIREAIKAGHRSIPAGHDGVQEADIVTCLARSVKRDPDRITTARTNFAEEQNAIEKAVKFYGKFSSSQEDAPYDVDKDVNAYYLQFDRESTSAGDSVFCPDTDGSAGEVVSGNKPGRSTGIDLNQCKVRGSFPDQKLSVHDLLTHHHADDDPHECIREYTSSSNKLKYIHIPCNNMEYVEKLIAKYYGEDAPLLGETPFPDPLEQSRAHMLLRPQYWRGQQHGINMSAANPTGLPVHARHLRPMCENISSDPPVPSGRKEDALAIFMPFLHWEYDRQRLKVARVIDEKAHQRRRDIRDQLHRVRWASRQRVSPVMGETTPNPRATNKSLESIGGVASVVMQKQPFKVSSSGRLLTALTATKGDKKSWGQFLLDSARLYEEIFLYRDRRMLDKYLFNEGQAPLHPRRTLDQSYNWTVRSTKDLDRAQVVYRGTTMDIRIAHRLQKETQHRSHRFPFANLGREKQKPTDCDAQSKEDKWVLLGKVGEHVSVLPLPEPLEPLVLWNGKPVKPRSDGSTGKSPKATEEAHDQFKETTCDQCRIDIRKISRLVMVDQLWMWILDSNTIITCFPRRYGMNRQDTSSVFKAVKARLQCGTIEIRSVFDLALIVLRECTNILLDRSQSQDHRPQVMDIFAETIGRIDHKLATQLDRVWRWTELASKKYRARYHDADMTDFYGTLLDIHRESMLQEQIRDIIDELNIMLGVQKKQKELIERFVRLASNSLLNTNNASGWGSSDVPLCTPEPKTTDPVISRQHKNFTALALELGSEMDNRIGELEALKSSAQSTAQDVVDLLNLKQQQASVVQARQSVRQGEETVRQSRSIMMFTIVTIFFLPLSFMSSIFGMNNSSFADDSNLMSLENQLAIMFPVSSAIIFVAVWIAFSKFFRTLFWAAYKLGSTRVAVWLPLYRLKLQHFTDWSSDKITSWTEKEVLRLKDRVEMEVEMARRKKDTEPKREQSTGWERLRRHPKSQARDEENSDPTDAPAIISESQSQGIQLGTISNRHATGAINGSASSGHHALRGQAGRS